MEIVNDKYSINGQFYTIYNVISYLKKTIMENVMNSKGQPYVVDVSANETKYICQCGKSITPPYCDGSHQGSDIEPLAYTANVDEQLYICGCGKSAGKPFCDGSHQ